MKEQRNYVRFKECFWIKQEVASKKSSNLYVGKLMVITKCFKIMLYCFNIMLQPCTINVLLSFLLWINVDSFQIFKNLIHNIICKKNRVYF